MVLRYQNAKNKEEKVVTSVYSEWPPWALQQRD